jgi:hypothetical protein
MNRHKFPYRFVTLLLYLCTITDAAEGPVTVHVDDPPPVLFEPVPTMPMSPIPSWLPQPGSLPPPPVRKPEVAFTMSYGTNLSGITANKDYFSFSIPTVLYMIYPLPFAKPIVRVDSLGNIHYGVSLGYLGGSIENTLDYGRKGLTQTLALKIDFFVGNAKLSLQYEPMFFEPSVGFDPPYSFIEPDRAY